MCVTHVCVCGHLCVWAHVKPQGWCWNHPHLFFHIIHWGKASYSNPELTRMTGLPGQLALGILCLCLPSLEVVRGWPSHAHPMVTWVLRKQTLTCTHAWQVPWPLSPTTYKRSASPKVAQKRRDSIIESKTFRHRPFTSRTSRLEMSDRLKWKLYKSKIA